ncbi:hypothetical protein ACFQL1_12320 [Halomicroarcula sp. GCM10025709]|uniref:hypothetical protein n=1 Tax=Halomicroarcula sp. GCM10025709 TaxID=3252669 RepID=UPI003610C35B
MVGGLDALSETWQWRQFVSLKDQIESMRTRDELAGYVITEWTDLEWEFNGILDYFREQKVFHDDFAAVNDALVAVVEPERHVCWAGEPLPVEVSVVNDTGVGGETTVSWAVRDGGDVVDTGETTVDVDAFETTTVDRPVLSLDAADAPAKSPSRWPSRDQREPHGTRTPSSSSRPDTMRRPTCPCTSRTTTSPSACEVHATQSSTTWSTPTSSSPATTRRPSRRPSPTGPRRCSSPRGTTWGRGPRCSTTVNCPRRELEPRVRDLRAGESTPRPDSRRQPARLGLRGHVPLRRRDRPRRRR